MNITIESHVLNHHIRSGLLTYTEGLVYGLAGIDYVNNYSLLYYSLSRPPNIMPGPQTDNITKQVLKIPDFDFIGRQDILDKIILPIYFKNNKTKIFHRTSGYTMPTSRNVFKILTVHDLRTLTIGDNLWKQNIQNYSKTINNLDVCVVVSECTKKDLVSHLEVNEEKIKVIYLGADKRFKPSSSQTINTVLNKYNINEPFLFSVGSVPRKNIDGIIKGFANSKHKNNYKLILSCYKDLDKYKALCKEFGVENRVVFLPNLSDDDVVALYSSCYCFIFPSLYEGFGLPILEAMQCGAPVITSNLSSCPEVAGDAAILVNPHKIEEISDAIDQICSNPRLREKLIVDGFNRSKLFSWDNYSKEILKIYSTA